MGDDNLHPVARFQQQIEARTNELAKALLGSRIPAEKFERVVLTAVTRSPELLAADRQSLFTSCIQAAQDGLLPDGRQGALVIYSEKRGDQWIKKVQWMPMIAGIRQKVANAQALRRWVVDVVRERDFFDWEQGLMPSLVHKPAKTGDRGAITHAWSLAVTKDGEVLIDVMDYAEAMRLKARSKTGKDNKGPWASDEPEMIKKSVARRHFKQIPLPESIHDLMQRDDDLYDTEADDGKRQEAQAQRIGSKMDRLAIGRSYAPQVQADTFSVGEQVRVEEQGDNDDAALPSDDDGGGRRMEGGADGAPAVEASPRRVK